MLFYYDNNGKLVTISPHGEIPRQGGALVLYVLMNKNFNDNANDPGEDGTGMQNRMMTARFKCPSEITFSEDYPMTLNSELWEFKKLPGESIGSLIDGEEYYLFTVDLSNTYANKEAGNLEIVFTLYKYEMENNEPVIDTSKTINLGRATVFVEETLGLAPYSGVGMTYTEYQSLMALLTQYNSYVNTELPKKADRINLEQKIEADIIRVNTIKGTVDDHELVNMVGDFYFNNNVIGNSGSGKALNLKSGNSENSVVIDNTKVKIEHTGEHPYETTTASVEVKSADVEIKATNIDLRADEILLDAEVYATVINGDGTNELLLRADYGVYIVSNGYSLIVDDLGITIKKGNAHVMSLRYDDLNDEHIIESNAILKDVKCNPPSQSQDLANKGYVDAVALLKADLNNSRQIITANKVQVNSVIDYSGTGEIEMVLSGMSFYAKKWDNPNQYRQINFYYDNGLKIDEPTYSYNPTTKNYVDNNLAGKGNKIDLEIDSDFKLKAKLYNGTTLLSTSTVIDLPLESVVVSGSYDSVNKKVILTLEDGSTIEFSVADLISGLQSEITENNKLNSDLVDDTNSTHKFVSAQEKAQITTNQNAISNIKDGTNIDSFGDVESALALKEDLSNKVTSVSSSSTDAQYPSAKCVYDNLDDYSSLNMTNAKIEEYMATYNNVSASLVGDKISLTNVTFENGYIKFNAKNVSFANGKIIINN